MMKSNKKVMSAFVALTFVSVAAPAAQRNLDSFEFVWSSPDQSSGDVFSRPAHSRFAPELAVVPSSLGDGGYVEFRMSIKVNREAAAWLPYGPGVGNLISVGLLKNNGINDFFHPSHEDDAVIWFQNGADSLAVFWNDKFFSGGTGGLFVFEDGGIAGVPNDNADQTAPEGGSWADYCVRIDRLGYKTLSVYYRDSEGRLLTDKAIAGGNPQVMTGMVDPNCAYFPAYRTRDGLVALPGRMVESRDAELIISQVPEPSSMGLLAVGVLSSFALRRSRQ